MMKILMLNYEFPPIGGGAGKATLCLLKEYAGNSDLSIDVLTSSQKPGFTVEKFADNITIYKVGVHKKNLHFWRKIEVLEWLFKAGPHYRRLVEENSYDLAHAFFGFPTAYLCYRSAERLPYIVSLRGSDVPGLNPRLSIDYKILGPLFRRIWQKAKLLIACSEGLKDRSLRFLPTVDIEVIANGVDMERFKPSGQTVPCNNYRLITVGRLSASKRFDMLISAVDIVRKRFTDVKLSIFGGGALKETLQRFVNQHQLQDVVELAGRVEAERMPELYRQHDIFVSATAQEGMSNAMLEAMASGLPIVTTECEGAEELIDDNGIVVPESEASAESLAEEIGKLIENPDVCRKMSTAAREKASQFSWQHVGQEYIRRYQAVIDRRSNRDD